MSLAKGSESNPNNCDTTPEGLASYDAVNDGIIVIAASGNDGYTTGIGNPACVSEVISVGMTSDDKIEYLSWPKDEANCTDSSLKVNSISCASNRHQILDLLAPGIKIESSVPKREISECMSCRPSGYINSQGTSASAPHVSGVVVLLKQAYPSLSPNDIKNLLDETGIPVYDNGVSRDNGEPTYLNFSGIDIGSAFAYLDVLDLGNDYKDASVSKYQEWQTNLSVDTNIGIWVQLEWWNDNSELNLSLENPNDKTFMHNLNKLESPLTMEMDGIQEQIVML